MAREPVAAWSVETAAAVELGAGGQPRLGEWGHPVILDNLAWVRPGLSWAWSSDVRGDAGNKLHFCRGLVGERDWVIRTGESMVCRAKVTASVVWECVPCLLPEGYVPARAVPRWEFCASCAREFATQTAADEAAVRAMTERGDGCELRPIVWRSRALWGVRGQEPWWDGEVEEREEGGEEPAVPV